MQRGASAQTKESKTGTDFPEIRRTLDCRTAFYSVCSRQRQQPEDRPAVVVSSTTAVAAEVVGGAAAVSVAAAFVAVVVIVVAGVVEIATVAAIGADLGVIATAVERSKEALHLKFGKGKRQ